MVDRRRYRPKSNSLGLPAWGWALLGTAFVVELVGIVLVVLGDHLEGTLLVGLGAMMVGGCVVLGLVTDRDRFS